MINLISVRKITEERLDEFSLAERAISGDRDSFDLLVSQHRPPLTGFIRRRVHRDEVDDVMQDTILSALTSVGKLKDPNQFKHWLFAIAKHKCFDTVARRRSHLTEEMTDVVDQSDLIGKSELNAMLRLATLKLDPEQMDLIESYYGMGFTLKEISDFSGVNLNTVKFRFYRAHQQLEQFLREDGYEIL